MRRHELTDKQWETLEAILPRNDRPGHPWKDHRQVLNGILWRLNTGAAWRDVPERYGPWQTVYDRFNYWQKTGMWTKIARSLQRTIDYMDGIDWQLHAVDATQIRASRAAAGARKKGFP